MASQTKMITTLEEVTREYENLTPLQFVFTVFPAKNLQVSRFESHSGHEIFLMPSFSKTGFFHEILSMFFLLVRFFNLMMFELLIAKMKSKIAISTQFSILPYMGEPHSRGGEIFFTPPLTRFFRYTPRSRGSLPPLNLPHPKNFLDQYRGV